jgi:hypothetical protein
LSRSKFAIRKQQTMKFILPLLLSLCFPILLCAQEGTFTTCYSNLCADGELTLKEIASTEMIDVKSTVDGSSYGIISFTTVYVLNGKKLECTCRENKLTLRCLSLKDKLLVGDQLIIKDVVFKDIKGGGKIRTAPQLVITVVKTDDEE